MKHARDRRWVSARWLGLWALALVMLVANTALAQQTVTLWHAYRGAEQQALDQVLRAFEREHPGVTVQTLAVPFDAYASKLEAAIPRGNGPDLFIDAHERLPSYRARNIIEPAGRRSRSWRETARGSTSSRSRSKR